MKSCKQCDEYDVCSRQNDLRRKKPRCPKAKVDKPMTNADRIRAMTDEELANFMEDTATWGGCPNHGSRDCTSDCGMCWISWLKSPVEVDNGN